MTINIGGKDRPFALDFAAFRVAERRHGVRISLADFSDIGLGDFAKYVWIGLLGSNHDLDELQVLKWMEGADAKVQKAWFDAVMEGVGTFGKLFDDEDAGKKPALTEVKAGGPSTGDKSSLSDTGS